MEASQVAAWAARFLLVVLGLVALNILVPQSGVVVAAILAGAVLVGLVWLALPRRRHRP
jgi:hypothetical protein